MQWFITPSCCRVCVRKFEYTHTYMVGILGKKTTEILGNSLIMPPANQPTNIIKWKDNVV